jgi:phage FluMu gp28-like protein
MINVPPVLIPFQQRWHGDQSPVKVGNKSRRIGLTWTQAGDDTLTAAKRESAGGMDVWYTGYNHDMALEYIEDCAFWARNYQLAAAEIDEIVIEDERKDIQAYRIRFASGFKVTALSSRPSNFRGKQGRAVIDEAAFHDNLDELLKAAMAFLMWGGQVVVISTQNGEENPFNTLVEDIRAGRKPYSLHEIDLDQALRDGLYQRICLKLGRKWSPKAETKWRQDLIDFYGEDADEELFLIPSKGSGVFLPGGLVQSCMAANIPVLRWSCKTSFAERPDHEREAAAAEFLAGNVDGLLESLPQNFNHFLGEDFGRSGDLTVLIPLSEEPGLVYRAPFVVELRNVPFRQQEQILFHICDRLPKFTRAALDARGNGQSLAEFAMQRYGSWRIEQVMLTESWYRENMPPYKAAFEDRTIVLPRDADILNDHRAAKMVKGVAKVPDTARFKGTDGGQRHGDALIAGALAMYAARNGIPAAAAGADPEERERPMGGRRFISEGGGIFGRFRQPVRMGGDDGVS